MTSRSLSPLRLFYSRYNPAMLDVILVVIVAIGFLVVLPSWGWYYENGRKCPACKKHKLKHLMKGVVSDPAPRSNPYRCRACGGEFVVRWFRFTTRSSSDWRDSDIWDETRYSN